MNCNNYFLSPGSDAELVAGNLIHNGIYGTEWEYNKYAIFNPNQVKIRYLIHVELTANDAASKVKDPEFIPFGKIVARGVWKYAAGNKWVNYDKGLSDVRFLTLFHLFHY